MDDFQIGHGRYAGPIRYLSDFPYTNFAHSRDSDFPYTNFWGDLDEIAIFKNKITCALMFQTKFLADDLDENIHFQNVKPRAP